MSKNTTSILLSGLPIPPSSNHQYKLFRRGGKTYHVPSKELIQYREAMEAYRYSAPNFLLAKEQMKAWMRCERIFEVNAMFFFHFKRLFTKQMTVKKFDVSNRLKSLHDCLSTLLEVDDSRFFKIGAEKAVGANHCHEMVVVEIFAIDSKHNE